MARRLVPFVRDALPRPSFRAKPRNPEFHPRIDVPAAGRLDEPRFIALLRGIFVMTDFLASELLHDSRDSSASLGMTGDGGDFLRIMFYFGAHSMLTGSTSTIRWTWRAAASTSIL